MGKKTRKTRWRTLSIGGVQSDSESQNGETVPKGHRYGRAAAPAWQNHGGPAGPGTRYNSSHSTPTRQYRSYNNGSKYETSKSTTRSSSTASENKITFNEDEYTRITTPRQDVLFKKGYLSRPKPHLQQQLQLQQQQHQQRSLTSAGNSTGDGTPDHQSADGAECGDADYEQSPFVFPAGPGFLTEGGVFFVNGYEPYAVPPAHVFVYDQYGNAAVCFPPPPPPPAHGPPPSYADHHKRVKRYSTDSMTESTSPHNESSQEPAYQDGDDLFETPMPGLFPVPYQNVETNGTAPEDHEYDTCEQRQQQQQQQQQQQPQDSDPRPLRRKRRRRKVSKSTSKCAEMNDHATSSAGEHDGDDDDDDDEDEEDDAHIPGLVNGHSRTPLKSPIADAPPEENPSPGGTSHDAPTTDSAPPDELSEDKKADEPTLEAPGEASIEEEGPSEPVTKYRVDAEEFVPRAYRPRPLSYVPLPVPLLPAAAAEMYAAGPFIPAVFVPPPPPPCGQYFIPGDRYCQHQLPPTEAAASATATDVSSTTGDSHDGDDVPDGGPVVEETQEDDDSNKKTNVTPAPVIDIAKIVSKLEEAAKEQKRLEERRQSEQNEVQQNPQTPEPSAGAHQVPNKEISEKTETKSPVSGSASTVKDTPIVVAATTVGVKKEAVRYSERLKSQLQLQPKTHNHAQLQQKQHQHNHQLHNHLPHTSVQQQSPHHHQQKQQQYQQQQQQQVQAVPRPKRQLLKTQKSVPNNPRPRGPAVASCPRLERTCSVPETSVAKSSPQPSASPDQWISVSGKKKRKNKLVQPSLESVPSEPETTQQPSSCIEVETNLPALEEPPKETPVAVKVEEEVLPKAESKTALPKAAVSKTEPAETTMTVESSPAPSRKGTPALSEETKVDKPKRERSGRNNTNNKKSVRKRIIINDGELGQVVLAPDFRRSTSAVSDEFISEQIQVKVVLSEPAEDVQLNLQIEEPAPPPATPVPAPAPVPREEVDTTVGLRQRKKKKNKSKTSAKDAADRDDSKLNDSLSGGKDSKTNVDVSFELDRMIQRGLYANVEQRLRSYNPGDTFIADVLHLHVPSASLPAHLPHHVSPAAATFKRFDFGGVMGPMGASLVSKRPVAASPASTAEEAKPVPDETLAAVELEDVEAPGMRTTQVDTATARFPITKAVREWMDRTRETTPEVEIFKRPNEIRQEFLVLAESDGEMVDDEEPGTVVASEVIDDRRWSREPSAGPDLLECWEPEPVFAAAAAASPSPTRNIEVHCAVSDADGIQHHSNATDLVEQAEDVLECYESVYGRSDDYARIHHDVLQQQQQCHTRGDGGLPYRAICCTVM